MTPGTISSGLVRTSSSSTSYVPPSRNDWDLLFQLMFDELLNPPPSVVNQAPEVISPIAEADIGIFIGYAPTKKAFCIYNRCIRRIVETIHVDFDELIALASEQSSSGPTLNDMTLGTISSGLVQPSSPSTYFVPPSRNDWILIPKVDDDSTGSPFSTIVDQDAPSSSKSLTPTEIQSSVILQDVGNDNLDIEVAHMGNDPLLGVPIPKVISVPVSTRLQLYEQALFCYYDAFLTSVEPKTYKEALTQACWIEAMQEELNKFERLEGWELVPRPDKVMVINLKWIYKVKLDEMGGILKNKACLVAHGYHQEEGIDFEESFSPDSSVALTDFADVDHAGCQDTRRSTSG
nr:retrovirus-related Pol polyprotein from transposon TNT 1-94 [Tanacetum cinerariifolium]